MRFVHLPAIIAAASCALASPSHAQLVDLLPGARVRVQPVADTSRVDGTIIARDAESLTVATLHGQQYRATLGALRTVDVYRGRSRMVGAKKGAIWGAAVIAVPLAIAFVARDPKRDGWSRKDELHLSLWAIRVYAETGAVIGAFVRAERWERCRSATAPTCESRP
jgi:hypothetical protein